MKNLLYIFLFLFVISCSEPIQKKMVVDLTNDSLKYWYRYHKDTLKPYNLGYCFNKDGTFRAYNNSNDVENKRIEYISPVLSKPYWKFINDTLLMCGIGDTFRIVFLTSDSVILKNVKFPRSDYLKMHREKDQYTKIN